MKNSGNSILVILSLIPVCCCMFLLFLPACATDEALKQGRFNEGGGHNYGNASNHAQQDGGHDKGGLFPFAEMIDRLCGLVGHGIEGIVILMKLSFYPAAFSVKKHCGIPGRKIAL